MDDKNHVYPNLSISEAVLSVAKECKDKKAMTYLGRAITYKKLLLKVERLSIALFEIGIQKGDRVLVALPNVPQAVYVLYALNRIGAVPVFVSPLSAEAELEFYINKCTCDFVIAIDMLYEKLLKVFEKTGDRVLVLTSPVDEIGFPFKSKKPKAVLWQNLFNIKKRGNIYISPQKYDDTAVILFSGGTTGTPKAVELTNLNLNALAEGTEAACGQNVRGVKMLSVLPVFHGFGLGICIHTVLYFGGNAILVPRFDRRKIGRVIAKSKPHYLAVVPAMLEPLMNSKVLEKADLSCLLGVFSGGDSLSTELQHSFNIFLLRHNSKVQIRQGFGLTECVAASCLMPDKEQRPQSVGKPYPNTLYKIVKINTADEVPSGEAGEICISGNMVMKGYFDDEAETQKTLKTHSDGRVWLHTGDIGFMDNSGFVYFKQRLKRIIVTNGYNVYPSEIEKVLLMHEKVKDCCVVGVKDKRKIQAVVVFAVLNNSRDESEDTKTELLKHLESYISLQAKPKEIFFIRNIPKTPMKKTAYAELESIAESNMN